MSTHPIRLFRSVRLWPADQGKVRRASWLELFFDLIFVAAVSQVGVPLGEDYSIHGLIRYSLMFLLIWWAWFGHTMYSTRFDADDVVHRLLTLVQRPDCPPTDEESLCRTESVYVGGPWFSFHRFEKRLIRDC